MERVVPTSMKLATQPTPISKDLIYTCRGTPIWLLRDQIWLSRNNTTTQTNPVMIDVADDFFGGKDEGDYHVDENEQAKFLTIAMLF